jgi:hypothetical protein
VEPTRSILDLSLSFKEESMEIMSRAVEVRPIRVGINDTSNPTNLATVTAGYADYFLRLIKKHNKQAKFMNFRHKIGAESAGHTVGIPFARMDTGKILCARIFYILHDFITLHIGACDDAEIYDYLKVEGNILMYKPDVAYVSSNGSVHLEDGPDRTKVSSVLSILRKYLRQLK